MFSLLSLGLCLMLFFPFFFCLFVEIHKTYPLVFSVFLSSGCKYKKRIIIKMIARYCKLANIILGFDKKKNSPAQKH